MGSGQSRPPSQQPRGSQESPARNAPREVDFIPPTSETQLGLQLSTFADPLETVATAYRAHYQGVQVRHRQAYLAAEEQHRIAIRTWTERGSHPPPPRDMRESEPGWVLSHDAEERLQLLATTGRLSLEEAVVFARLVDAAHRFHSSGGTEDDGTSASDRLRALMRGGQRTLVAVGSAECWCAVLELMLAADATHTLVAGGVLGSDSEQPVSLSLVDIALVAVTTDGEYAPAWELLGKSMRRMGIQQVAPNRVILSAFDCFARAVAIDPLRAASWRLLASVSAREPPLNHRLQFHFRAAALRPALPDVWFDLLDTGALPPSILVLQQGHCVVPSIAVLRHREASLPCTGRMPDSQALDDGRATVRGGFAALLPLQSYGSEVNDSSAADEASFPLTMTRIDAMANAINASLAQARQRQAHAVKRAASMNRLSQSGAGAAAADIGSENADTTLSVPELRDRVAPYFVDIAVELLVTSLHGRMLLHDEDLDNGRRVIALPRPRQRYQKLSGVVEAALGGNPETHALEAVRGDAVGPNTVTPHDTQTSIRVVNESSAGVDARIDVLDSTRDARMIDSLQCRSSFGLLTQKRGIQRRATAAALQSSAALGVRKAGHPARGAAEQAREDALRSNARSVFSDFANGNDDERKESLVEVSVAQCIAAAAVLDARGLRSPSCDAWRVTAVSLAETVRCFFEMRPTGQRFGAHHCRRCAGASPATLFAAENMLGRVPEFRNDMGQVVPLQTGSLSSLSSEAQDFVYCDFRHFFADRAEAVFDHLSPLLCDADGEIDTANVDSLSYRRVLVESLTASLAGTVLVASREADGPAPHADPDDRVAHRASQLAAHATDAQCELWHCLGDELVIARSHKHRADAASVMVGQRRCRPRDCYLEALRLYCDWPLSAEENEQRFAQRVVAHDAPTVGERDIAAQGIRRQRCVLWMKLALEFELIERAGAATSTTDPTALNAEGCWRFALSIDPSLRSAWVRLACLESRAAVTATEKMRSTDVFDGAPGEVRPAPDDFFRPLHEARDTPTAVSSTGGRAAVAVFDERRIQRNCAMARNVSYFFASHINGTQRMPWLLEADIPAAIGTVLRHLRLPRQGSCWQALAAAAVCTVPGVLRGVRPWTSSERHVRQETNFPTDAAAFEYSAEADKSFYHDATLALPNPWPSAFEFVAIDDDVVSVLKSNYRSSHSINGADNLRLATVGTLDLAECVRRSGAEPIQLLRAASAAWDSLALQIRALGCDEERGESPTWLLEPVECNEGVAVALDGHGAAVMEELRRGLDASRDSSSSSSDLAVWQAETTARASRLALWLFNRAWTAADEPSQDRWSREARHTVSAAFEFGCAVPSEEERTRFVSAVVGLCAAAPRPVRSARRVFHPDDTGTEAADGNGRQLAQLAIDHNHSSRPPGVVLADGVSISLAGKAAFSPLKCTALLLQGLLNVSLGHGRRDEDTAPDDPVLRRDLWSTLAVAGWPPRQRDLQSMCGAFLALGIPPMAHGAESEYFAPWLVLRHVPCDPGNNWSFSPGSPQDLCSALSLLRASSSGLGPDSPTSDVIVQLAAVPTETLLVGALCRGVQSTVDAPRDSEVAVPSAFTLLACAFCRVRRYSDLTHRRSAMRIAAEMMWHLVELIVTACHAGRSEIDRSDIGIEDGLARTLMSVLKDPRTGARPRMPPRMPPPAVSDMLRCCVDYVTREADRDSDLASWVQQCFASLEAVVAATVRLLDSVRSDSSARSVVLGCLDIANMSAPSVARETDEPRCVAFASFCRAVADDVASDPMRLTEDDGELPPAFDDVPRAKRSAVATIRGAFRHDSLQLLPAARLALKALAVSPSLSSSHHRSKDSWAKAFALSALSFDPQWGPGWSKALAGHTTAKHASPFDPAGLSGTLEVRDPDSCRVNRIDITEALARAIAFCGAGRSFEWLWLGLANGQRKCQIPSRPPLSASRGQALCFAAWMQCPCAHCGPIVPTLVSSRDRMARAAALGCIALDSAQGLEARIVPHCPATTSNVPQNSTLDDVLHHALATACDAFRQLIQCEAASVPHWCELVVWLSLAVSARALGKARVRIEVAGETMVDDTVLSLFERALEADRSLPAPWILAAEALDERNSATDAAPQPSLQVGDKPMQVSDCFAQAASLCRLPSTHVLEPAAHAVRPFARRGGSRSIVSTLVDHRTIALLAPWRRMYSMRPPSRDATDRAIRITSSQVAFVNRAEMLARHLSEMPGDCDAWALLALELVRGAFDAILEPLGSGKGCRPGLLTVPFDIEDHGPEADDDAVDDRDDESDAWHDAALRSTFNSVASTSLSSFRAPKRRQGASRPPRPLHSSTPTETPSNRSSVRLQQPETISEGGTALHGVQGAPRPRRRRRRPMSASRSETRLVPNVHDPLDGAVQHVTESRSEGSGESDWTDDTRSSASTEPSEDRYVPHVDDPLAGAAVGGPAPATTSPKRRRRRRRKSSPDSTAGHAAFVPHVADPLDGVVQLHASPSATGGGASVGLHSSTAAGGSLAMSSLSGTVLTVAQRVSLGAKGKRNRPIALDGIAGTVAEPLRPVARRWRPQTCTISGQIVDATDCVGYALHGLESAADCSAELLVSAGLVLMIEELRVRRSDSALRSVYEARETLRIGQHQYTAAQLVEHAVTALGHGGTNERSRRIQPLQAISRGKLVSVDPEPSWIRVAPVREVLRSVLHDPRLAPRQSSSAPSVAGPRDEPLAVARASNCFLGDTDLDPSSRSLRNATRRQGHQLPDRPVPAGQEPDYYSRFAPSVRRPRHAPKPVPVESQGPSLNDESRALRAAQERRLERVQQYQEYEAKRRHFQQGGRRYVPGATPDRPPPTATLTMTTRSSLHTVRTMPTSVRSETLTAQEEVPLSAAPVGPRYPWLDDSQQALSDTEVTAMGGGNVAAQRQDFDDALYDAVLDVPQRTSGAVGLYDAEAGAAIGGAIEKLDGLDDVVQGSQLADALSALRRS